jgi:hypothetical protein
MKLPCVNDSTSYSVCTKTYAGHTDGVTIARTRGVQLQGADFRWVTAGAGLYITCILMAILGPTGPSIRVDGGVFQNQLPRMCGIYSAAQLNSCRLETAWWHPVISSRAPHCRSSPLIVSQSLASNAVP